MLKIGNTCIIVLGAIWNGSNWNFKIKFNYLFQWLVLGHLCLRYLLDEIHDHLLVTIPSLVGNLDFRVLLFADVLGLILHRMRSILYFSFSYYPKLFFLLSIQIKWGIQWIDFMIMVNKIDVLTLLNFEHGKTKIQ
jgi:hypothetical protein